MATVGVKGLKPGRLCDVEMNGDSGWILR